jgi:hypothetical protein
MTGSIGNSKIIDNDIFNGRYQITVSNGQYFKFPKLSFRNKKESPGARASLNFVHGLALNQTITQSKIQYLSF